MKINYEIYDDETKTLFSKEDIADFLFDHLDEYGDKRAHILKAITYALGEEGKPGGLILLALDKRQIVGAVVLNDTQMGGYIPENILVYIAVNSQYRGEGIGKELMRMAIEHTRGDIALHVEKDNPARFLYEKMGFATPYLEMRLKKS